MERYVVSTPAGRSSRTNEKISSSLSCSPSSSAWARSLMRSSCGSRRRSSRMAETYSFTSWEAAIACSCLAEEAQDGDRPPLELLVVLARKPEQPGDDLSGIGKGEFGDEFRVSTVGEAIDQAVGDLLSTSSVSQAGQHLLRKAVEPRPGSGDAVRRPCRG